MDATLLALPVLALLDSTSFGTLLVPLWLMTSRHVPLRQHLLYLAAVAALYWVLGLALASGLASLSRWEGLLAALDTSAARVGQLLLGVALLIFALLPQRWRPAGRRGRAARWRDRHLRDGASVRPLLTLALVAVAFEALTMLPYLGAVALLAAADVSGTATAGLLLGYCLLMVLPALLLLAARRLAARRVEPTLVRIERLVARSGTEATLWAVGLVGFLLASHAALRLGLLGSA